MSAYQNDVIAFVEKGEVIAAVIARWSGRSDSYAKVMDDSCFVRMMYESQWIEAGQDWNGLVILQLSLSTKLKVEFAKLLKTKKAKEALRDINKNITARYDSKNRLIWSAKADEMIEGGGDPSPGRGALPVCQEPWEISDSDGNLTTQMTNHIARHEPTCDDPNCPDCHSIRRLRRWAEMDDRALEDLKRRKPLHYQVLMARMVDYERLVDIGARMGLSYENTKKISQRAIAFVDRRRAAYGGEDNAA